MTDTLILILTILIVIQTTYLIFSSKIHQVRRPRRDLIFVDTSVLIDGRILDIATAGFIPGTLSIPRSVIGELQLLADQGDHDKRSRARHGLDVVSQLQAIPGLRIELYNDRPTKHGGVDSRLLELAKRHNGIICTIDFNLIKVAIVEGVAVLNINDLAKTLRMAYLPGEQTTLELTQRGNDQHQAVGHLGDGTMVVVEQAGGLIGQSVTVEFIRSLQTAAGRMMFAKLVGESKPKPKPQPVRVLQQRESTKQRPQAPQQPESKQKQSAKQPMAKKRPNRRVTNEDRLVDLANQ